MPIYKGQIPSFTWSAKPAASSYVGQAFISDLGANGTLIYSNGVRWIVPIFSLINSAVPTFVPSSGTVGNNGALSGITAFPVTFPSVYLYFPANAIFAGSTAGLYYCVMSSTTAGTIYNNTYSTGNPIIPSSPTAFSTTGPGAYVQTTGSDITLLAGTINGNVLGKNGVIKYRAISSYNNSVNNKTIKYLLDSSSVNTATLTTTATLDTSKNVHNCGVENKQTAYLTGAALNTASSVNVSYLSVDTTIDKQLSFSVQLANASDYAGISQALVEIIS